MCITNPIVWYLGFLKLNIFQVVTIWIVNLTTDQYLYGEVFLPQREWSKEMQGGIWVHAWIFFPFFRAPWLRVGVSISSEVQPLFKNYINFWISFSSSNYTLHLKYYKCNFILCAISLFKSII